MQDQEFFSICDAGLVDTAPEPATDISASDAWGFDEAPAHFERPRGEFTITRALRDRAFTRQIQDAYQKRCAFTGLRLINGGGRSEAQAAHIWPVQHNGPDSIRNGLALSGTVHWMFDRGLISVDDDFRILKAGGLVSEEVGRLLHPSGGLLVPEEEHLRPHPHFLRYHRENIFKG